MMTKLTGEFCRTCLSTENKLTSFDESLREILNEYVPFIKIANEINPQVCATCKRILIEFKEFHGRCRRAEEILSENEEKGEDKDEQKQNGSDETVEANNDKPYLRGSKTVKSSKNLSTDTTLNRRHECPICNHKLALSKIDVHFATHPNAKRDITCEQCLKTFYVNAQLNDHILRNHLVMSKCPYCSKPFVNNSNVRRHISNVHMTTNRMTCQTCGKTLNNAASLRVHMAKHRADVHMRKSLCNVCGLKFVNVEEHTKRCAAKKLEDKRFQCRYCWNKYESVAKLRVHYKRDHWLERSREGLGVKCELCGKMLLNSDSLYQHKKSVHSTSRPHECKVCGFRFKNSGTLRVHMRRHTNERPYVCSICDQRFRQSYVLNNHMRTHADEKPHVCEVCGRAFKHKSAMRSHVKTVHMRIKRSSTLKTRTLCNICGKLVMNIYDHERRCMSSKDLCTENDVLKAFACEICGKTFKKASTHRLHVRKHTEVRNTNVEYSK